MGTQAAAEASFGIAVWLRRYFSCEDCRSFFDGLVQEETVGMPDVSDLNRDHHAYWWHHAHNMASEHFASVRGGDPWVAQLWNEDFKKYQNPFMMTWKDAEDQWVSPKRASSTPSDVPSFAKSAFSLEPLLYMFALLSAHVASIPPSVIQLRLVLRSTVHRSRSALYCTRIFFLRCIAHVRRIEALCTAIGAFCGSAPVFHYSYKAYGRILKPASHVLAS